jgi:hypothetical protein
MNTALFNNWMETALPEPVRRLKRSRLGVQISSFHSRKNKKSWGLESSIELDYAHFLEWSEDVLSFVPQPMEIQILQRGRTKAYVPDFMHISTKMDRTVTEIKPKGWDESPFLVEKYEACKTELALRGLRFQVITDVDIRKDELHRNLRHLYPSYKTSSPEQVLAVFAALSRMNKRATVGELMALPNPPTYAACAAFAYENWVDIHSKPFGLSTVLEIGD